MKTSLICIKSLEQSVAQSRQCGNCYYYWLIALMLPHQLANKSNGWILCVYAIQHIDICYIQSLYMCILGYGQITFTKHLLYPKCLFLIIALVITTQQRLLPFALYRLRNPEDAVHKIKFYKNINFWKQNVYKAGMGLIRMQLEEKRKPLIVNSD